jgi:hypothetical protein
MEVERPAKKRVAAAAAPKQATVEHDAEIEEELNALADQVNKEQEMNAMLEKKEQEVRKMMWEQKQKLAAEIEEKKEKEIRERIAAEERAKIEAELMQEQAAKAAKEKEIEARIRAQVEHEIKVKRVEELRAAKVKREQEQAKEKREQEQANTIPAIAPYMGSVREEMLKTRLKTGSDNECAWCGFEIAESDAFSSFKCNHVMHMSCQTQTQSVFQKCCKCSDVSGATRYMTNTERNIVTFTLPVEDVHPKRLNPLRALYSFTQNTNSSIKLSPYAEMCSKAVLDEKYPEPVQDFYMRNHASTVARMIGGSALTSTNANKLEDAAANAFNPLGFINNNIRDLLPTQTKCKVMHNEYGIEAKDIINERIFMDEWERHGYSPVAMIEFDNRMEFFIKLKFQLRHFNNLIDRYGNNHLPEFCKKVTYGNRLSITRSYVWEAMAKSNIYALADAKLRVEVLMHFQFDIHWFVDNLDDMHWRCFEYLEPEGFKALGMNKEFFQTQSDKATLITDTLGWDSEILHRVFNQIRLNSTEPALMSKPARGSYAPPVTSYAAPQPAYVPPPMTQPTYVPPPIPQPHILQQVQPISLPPPTIATTTATIPILGTIKKFMRPTETPPPLSAEQQQSAPPAPAPVEPVKRIFIPPPTKQEIPLIVKRPVMQPGITPPRLSGNPVASSYPDPSIASKPRRQRPVVTFGLVRDDDDEDDSSSGEEGDD